MTITYCDLLLGTRARRDKLMRGKGFLCECERCRDPGERGPRLAGLRCTKCSSG